MGCAVYEILVLKLRRTCLLVRNPHENKQRSHGQTWCVWRVQTWSSSERVIEMTLTLFKDLTGGYMSGKVLSKLDAVSFMLANHSPSHYTFLQSSSNTRNRTTFYSTLARMIFMEDSPAKFVAFVEPLKGILDGIAAASANGTNAAVLRQSVPVDTVIGLFRDLYGIAQATMSRRAYMCVPSHTPLCAATAVLPVLCCACISRWRACERLIDRRGRVGAV